jgi:ubiquinone biosynthesis monooxygenase Coq7
MNTRVYTPADRLIGRLDLVLRTVLGADPGQRRPSPAAGLPDPPLAAEQRRHAAGLMRVNHTGEVCAQALYVGQAAVSRESSLQESLERAAAEERDHLYWCAERLGELGDRPSLLNPLWFAGSLAIGMAAAAVGDKWSLGFVEETERQVTKHLESHLERLPENDVRSRAIVAVMRDDEARHAADAAARGARALSEPIRGLMAIESRIMTRVAYWI